MTTITIPRGVVEEATERAMFCAQQFIDAAEKPASVKQAFAWELRDAAASLRSALEEPKAVEPAPKSDQAMEVLRELTEADAMHKMAQGKGDEWAIKETGSLLADAWSRAYLLAAEGQAAQPDSVNVAAPAANGGWQPIESAPKDGTRFWACQAGAVEAGELFWDDPTGWCAPAEDFEEPNWEPTHWMPLPAPPAIAAAPPTAPQGDTE